MIVNNDNLAEEESISSTNQEDSIKQISITMSEIVSLLTNNITAVS